MLDNELFVAYVWGFTSGAMTFSLLAYGLIRWYDSYKADKYKKRRAKFKVIQGGRSPLDNDDDKPPAA